MITGSWRFWLRAFAFSLPATSGFAQTGALDSARGQLEQARQLRLQQGPENLQRAIVLLRTAGAAFRGGHDSRSEATALNQIAAVYNLLRKEDSAFAYSRSALTIYSGIGDRAGEARALNVIGDAFDIARRPDSAMVYYRAAVTKGRHAGDPGSEAAGLYNIGVAFHGTGHPDSSLAYYRAALPLQRETGDRAGEATTLNGIGHIFDDMGNPDSALIYLEAALPMFRELGDRVGEANSLQSLGLVFHHTGALDSALHSYDAALKIQREIGDPLEVSQTLNNIGGFFDDVGFPDSALAYYRTSLQVDTNEVRSGRTLGNIAMVFEGLGRPDSALSYLQMARQILHEAGDRVGEAGTLNSIVNNFADQGKYDSALVYYRTTLELFREAGYRKDEGSTLYNIARLFDDLDQPDSALIYLKRSLQIRREVGDRHGEARTLSSIGLHLGRDSVLGYWRAALDIRREIGDRHGEANSLLDLGLYWYYRSSDSRVAAAHFDSSAAVSATIRQNSGDESNRIAFAETRAFLTQLWARAWLAGQDEVGAGPSASAALAAVERGRARALLDVLRRNADSAAGTAGIVTDLTQPGGDLVAEADQFIGPLRRSGIAALSYLVTDDTLIIWLLTPVGDLVVAQSAVSSDSLAGLVGLLRAGLGADSARGAMARGMDQEVTVAFDGLTGLTAGHVDNTASALTRLLLPAEVLALVPAGTELVVVPHGFLGLVPFSMLPVTDGGVPLGIRNPLRFTPSLTSLAAIEERLMTDRASLANRALVVGSPSMPTVTVSGGKRIQLSALPAALKEGELLATRLRIPLLTGPAASETTIRQRLSEATLVHLATHGLAYGNEARVRESYIALAPDSLNDGLLTLGELVDDPALTISAELVVLSACQTGLGDLKRAEGTIGLQRGLLARGARSVLVSLWSVDDRATALLMDRFYEHWLKDRDTPGKAEALRRAQMDVRNQAEFRHPRYWAAFQLVGAN